MQVTRLRPLSWSEVVDVSIKIYRSFFGSLVRPVAIALLPAAALSGVIFASLASGSPFTTQISPTTGQEIVHVNNGELTTYLGGLALLLVVNALAVWVAQATCVLTIADGYLGGVPSWRRSLAFAWRRFGSVTWVLVLAALGSLLGLALFIVPGVFLYVSWFVALPALLLEDTRGTKALGRSLRLVRGRWWATFLTIALLELVIGVISDIFRSLVTFAVGGLVGHGAVAAGLAYAIGYAVTQVLLFPLEVCVALVIYIDLRVRKEGFDLQLLATSVGAGNWSGDPPAFLPPSGYPPGWRPPAGWAPPPGPPGGGWPGTPGYGQGWGPPQGWGAPPGPSWPGSPAGGFGAPPPAAPAPAPDWPPPSTSPPPPAPDWPPPSTAPPPATPHWPALSPKPSPEPHFSPEPPPPDDA